MSNVNNFHCQQAGTSNTGQNSNPGIACIGKQKPFIIHFALHGTAGPQENKQLPHLSYLSYDLLASYHQFLYMVSTAERLI